MSDVIAALNNVVDALPAAIAALGRQEARLSAALTEIADADYRGNRSQESEIAHRALVAEGFRHDKQQREENV